VSKKPVPKKNTTPAFTALSETEQREVAERLLKIEQSGWRPFWCPDPTCAGFPHPVYADNGNGPEVQFVDDKTVVGPNGEPIGYWCHHEGTGTDRAVMDARDMHEDDELIGRVIVDPRWAHNHARQDQRLPSWKKPWTLFIMSGRGTGKTTTGVEFVTLSARKGLDGAIIGRRGTELINTHVKTIIARAHPEFVPEYQASKDILVWPNGAVTYLFSAERPENIRSVNLSYFWMDEAAFMPEVETAWMNARLATRIETPGNPIHVLVTSTPTSTDWVMKMEDDPEVEVRRVSTYANRANLSPDFLKMLQAEYEGTRMGRQELYGEVLRDVEGSLWNDDMFEHLRVGDGAQFFGLVQAMDDVVVAIDPAGSKGPRSDATGIIAVGVIHTDEDGNRLAAPKFFVLADGTIKGTPNEWAERAFKVAYLVQASRIVAEKNFGGDMVKQVLTDYARLNPKTTKDVNGEDYRIEVVHAVKSKETRAEGTVGKYEQSRVVHVTSTTAFGDLSTLEKEQVTWVPKSRGGRHPSPNRIDALVWGVRAVETAIKFAVQQASSASVLSKIKRR